MRPSAQLPLAYHSYALLITLLDAEWTRSSGTGLQAFSSAKKAFEDSCSHYKSGSKDSMDAHRQRWAAGRELHHLDDGGSVDPALFRAVTWLPCGHADLLCAVLIDDLDAAQTIVERYPKTVEEVTLAFCPDVESTSPCIVSPAWFTQPPAPGDPSLGSPGSKFPLLAYMRLKLEGLLITGRALRVQNAVFRLIARRIENLCSNTTFDNEDLFTPAELQNLRIALLDLQDEEEIGLLIACNNFSAAMAVSADLQNLTIQDLLNGTPDLRDEWGPCLEDFGPAERATLKEIILNGDPTPPIPEPSLLDLVSGSHLLRWSRTTVGYGYDLFAKCCDLPTDQPPDNHVSGFVKGMVGLHIPPGHRQEADLILSKAAEALGPDLPALQNACYQTMGTVDLIVSGETVGSTQELKAAGKTIHSLDLLRMFSAVVRHFPEHTQAPRGGRHISGWTSTIQVPVPGHQHRALPTEHRFIIGKVLNHITKTLFPERFGSSPSAPPSADVFSLAAIRTHTRDCGFPVALRRSLMFLFENIGAILANPRLFEVMLDFADFLSALNAMLTDVIPHELGVKDPPIGTDHAYLDRIRVERPQVDQLALVLDALSTSMELRLRRVYPEQDTRDWSIDFRSSLSQILSAGEASLKAAAGFVRKYGLQDSAPVSVTTRLSMSPGIRANPIPLTARHNQLGPTCDPPLPKEDRPRLAVFDADVFHYTDLRSFIHFFHESYHLIYSDPVKPIAPTLEIGQLGKSDYQLSKLAEEVFVQILMWLTVFDEDETLMIQDFSHFWSTTLEDDPKEYSNENIEKEKPKTRQERDLNSFAENFATILIAILCGRVARSHSADHPLDRSQRPTPPSAMLPLPGPPSLNEVIPFIQRSLITAAPMLEDPHLRNHASQPAFLQIIAQIYDGLYPHLPELWGYAHEVYIRFTSDIPHSRTDTPAPPTPWLTYLSERRRLDQKFQQLMQPTPSSEYRPWPGCHLHDDHGEAMDGTLLTLTLLYNYLRYLYDWSEPTPVDGTPLQHLLSRPYKDRQPSQSRKPDFDAATCYANFLIDSSAILPFSCSPSARRHRLGVDTCVVKMLWDLTSRHRRRRLRRLMEACTRVQTQSATTSASV